MENILEHALIICRQGPIEVRHLPEYLAGAIQPRTSTQKDSRFASSEARERQTISKALAGHRGRTASALGMDRTTLWRKMKRLGLNS